MAALDFPLVPNTESEVTTGDITWKWNGYAWYAASQGDDVYLSKVTDDEAAGAITFKALTTHEGGVSVTGGTWQTVSDGITRNADSSGTLATGISLNAGGQKVVTLGSTSALKFNVSPTIDGTSNFKYGASISAIFSGTANTEANGLRVQPTTENLTTTNFKFIDVGSNGTDPTTIENVYGVYVGSGIAYGTTSSSGFHSAIDGADNYNFYAAGNAPNYFAGGVQFDLTHSQGGTQDQLLLNVYEEGTFTVDCDNAATDSMSKDGLSFYRVIGKTVTYAIRIGLNADGDQTLSAGNYVITGFPFTNIGANSGGVVTFVGQSTSDKGRTLGSFFVKAGGIVELVFTLDSSINNVRMIRCTTTAVLKD